MMRCNIKIQKIFGSILVALFVAIPFGYISAEEQSGMCKTLVTIVGEDKEKSYLNVEVKEVESIDGGNCELIQVGKTYRLTGGFILSKPPEVGAPFFATVDVKPVGTPPKDMLMWDNVTVPGSDRSIGYFLGDLLPIGEQEEVEGNTEVDSDNTEEETDNTETETDEEIKSYLMDEGILDSISEIEKRDNESVYTVKGTRERRLLFIFKVNPKITLEYNSETKEVSNVKKPWWYIFTSKS